MVAHYHWWDNLLPNATFDELFVFKKKQKMTSIQQYLQPLQLCGGDQLLTASGRKQLISLTLGNYEYTSTLHLIMKGTPATLMLNWFINNIVKICSCKRGYRITKYKQSLGYVRVKKGGFWGDLSKDDKV